MRLSGMIRAGGGLPADSRARRRASFDAENFLRFFFITTLASCATSVRAHFLANKHIADHGCLPCFPFDSGSIAIILMKNESRFIRAAALINECTSIGFHPNGSKNAGPSGGPNFNGAFAEFKCSPTCF